MKHKKKTFDQFFHDFYQERWLSLKASLLQSSPQVIRATKYAPEHIKSEQRLYGHPQYSVDLYDEVNKRSKQGIKHHYVMDLASILCAKSLPVSSDDFILDMCAAPGGKSLILLEQLENGQLWSNEISAARRSKLKSVIQDYVPMSDRERVFIKGKDGNRYGLMHPETFDKILVDAPCSGEQHLLHSPTEFSKWSEKRTKRLAQAQYSLLCSALLACKSRGQILYSTCSISPLENDGVIEKLLLKKGDHIELSPVEIEFEGMEKTKFGYQLLPDKSKIGPIYFSLLSKK